MDPGGWAVRSLALPLLEVRRGTQSRAFLKVALRNLTRPLEELRAEQWARMRRLVDHAYRSVPHYHDVFRGVGLRPADLTRPEDFRKIPPLTKETIQRQPDRLRSKDFAARRPAEARTGGSTGQPLQYFLDRDSLGWQFALQWRGWGYAGFRFGDRRATLAGLSLVAGGSPFRAWLRTRVMERNLALPAIRLTPSLVEEYLQRLRRYRPKYLLGYPSALVVFARFGGGAASGLGLRAIFTTAEMLYPDERRVLTDAFGCPVLDGYGANDGGISAYECGEHPGYHVDVERGLLEVIAEGEAATPGERGEVLATDLHGYAMPFIRYAVGDVAVPSGSRPACGRSLPLLDRIEGRTTDFLVVGETVLSGPAITLIFKDLALEDYRIEQTGESAIRVDVVPREGVDATDRVRSALQSQLGSDVSINVRAVERIDRPPGGKRRFIVSSFGRTFR